MSKTIGNDNTISPGGGDQHNTVLNPGDTLGQYKIIKLFGRGGMGEVYEVEHTTLEKHFTGKWFW